jgi:hypothetical protein
MFSGEVRTYLSGALLQGRLHALHTKGLPENNALAHYEYSSNYGHKKFCNIGP